MVDGFDTVLAPVHAAIDDLDAYLDPALTPPDFLEWLGGWLGLVVDRRWPIRRRREFVAKAVGV
jgi:phage tail-like protein